MHSCDAVPSTDPRAAPSGASPAPGTVEHREQGPGTLRSNEALSLVQQAALGVVPSAVWAWVWVPGLSSEPTCAGSCPAGVQSQGRQWLDPLIGAAFAHGTPVYHPDVRQLEGSTADSNTPLRTVFVAPLADGRRVVGALVVAGADPDAFDAAGQSRLAAVAGSAVVALDNAQLYDELDRRKRHMEAVIRCMADGLIVLDPDRRIVSLNPAAESMLGLEEAEMLGWSPADGAPDPRFQALLDICEPCEGDSDIPSHPLLLDSRSQKGQPEVTVNVPARRILKVLSSPIRSAAEEFGGEIKVLHDVTSEREFERLQDDFISTVSHELRTPLFSIRGFVELILKGKVPDAETQREFLTRVLQQANHLASIVSDLLDTSRMQAGNVELTIKPTDLVQVVRDALAKLASVAERQQMTLRMEAPTGLPPILADARRIEQVVTNLVGNAVKFSPPGSLVIVRLSASEGQVTVEVIDHGIGIPKEAMARLFTRFYQADSSATRQANGTGLGLYISRRIVEAHGGRIWAESEPGQGSVFRFTIPTRNEGEWKHGA